MQNQQIHRFHPPVGRLSAWFLPPLVACALALPALGQSGRVILNAEPGYTIAWDGNNGGYFDPELWAAPSDNAALASNGAAAFGSSEYGSVHFIGNVNDGLYGNSSSWIANFADPGADPDPFVGVAFGRTVAISGIAWGRDNGDTTEPGCEGGTCTDRAVGVYTLQVTRVASPDVATAETGNAATGWATVGTVEYVPGDDDVFFTAHLRHRFDVLQGNEPIQATGLRLKVSPNTLAIDEIEVNPAPDPVPPISSFVLIEPTGPYTISWDRNDGAFQDPAASATVPRNRALAAQGTFAFGSTEYGSGHLIANVNDGLYGNSHSWIPDFALPDPEPFVGLNFGGLIQLYNIAWSRDNGDATETGCAGGACTDRALGRYTLQMTQAPDPGVATPETGDASTGWVTLGTIDFRSAGTLFTPHLRHRFELGQTNNALLQASGVRIKVPNTSTAIDEIEVNVNVGQELGLVVATPEPGYSIEWDGNDGDFYDPTAGARAPDHDGLAANGAVAFGSSELDYGVHFITKVNDGLYGNSSSWICVDGTGGANDPDPFIGIRFGKTIEISSLAWGRDNGDETEAGCGGTCLDRWQGVNTIQITTVPDPGVDTPETGDAETGWITLGVVEYLSAAPPSFNPSRRHRFDVSSNGQPVFATAVRIKAGTPELAIDELEINPEGEAIQPPVSDLIVISSGPGFTVTWDGNDGQFNNAAAGGPPPDNLALAAHGTAAFGTSEFGPEHLIAKVNDGLYGNSQSWMPNFNAPDPAPFVGLNFGRMIGIRAVAWSRDNGDAAEAACGGTCTDRVLGTYTLQVTRVANPGPGTPETGEAETGWLTVATLEYKGGFATLFNPHLRHRYGIATSAGTPVAATGLRLKVPNAETAIDEIEVNPAISPDQNALLITIQEGYGVTWDGNDGDYFTPAPNPGIPNNAALALNGATAFGSSELQSEGRLIANVNDGSYGDASSWIADVDGGDESPYIGVRFGREVAIREIAFGRDNGDDTDLTPPGSHTNRVMGVYILQVTTVGNPGVGTEETGDVASGWATVASFLYRGSPSASFHHHLRHAYGVSFEGSAIPATAIRIFVPTTAAETQIAMDEIEVNTEAPISQSAPVLSVAWVGGDLRISWTGAGVLQSANDVTGEYTDLPGASPQIIVPSETHRFYRVRP